jgi:vacuolar-type H+-ATPase subunit E/Vma4
MEAAAANASESLCTAILGQAQQAGQEVLRAARRQAELLTAQANTEAQQFQEAELSRIRIEAGRRRDLALATVPLELERERRAMIESELNSIHERARAELAARRGFDYRAAIVALAAEAIHQMAGEAFVVKLLPEDFPALEQDLVEAIQARLGPPQLTMALLADPALTGGGVMVQDPAGRQLYDNRLPIRLERLWPELRRQIVRRFFPEKKTEDAES